MTRSDKWIYLVVRRWAPGMEPHMVGVRRAFTTHEAAITYRDEMAHAMQGSPVHHYEVQRWRLDGPVDLGFMQAAS